MKSIRSVRTVRVPLLLAAGFALSASGTLTAGELPQVNLSVRVDMAPATFAPGGHNMFSVTVHNAGPDTAGIDSAIDRPIGVFGNSIVFSPPQAPPLEIFNILSGSCWIDRWSEPLPNGQWVVQFSYYFAPLAAGESHTCISEIEFSSQTTADITTSWRVDSPRDTDTNPSNNRVDYTFVAVLPTSLSVPAGSPWGWIVLGFACVLMVNQMLRHTANGNVTASE